ncbi:Outer membrane protein beta-barrel domain-containing protein [Catalinimonas alkaloidigena]|uniref:Outer membrane protein beta-barrel domain-containing protein n=1 Tax=Catalinimonas alkaloidigena TaxID=1075417 RepID=A0A1G9T1V5_9BACT|nr:porin family protein [Catalinimonas alkaloidigena]SDM41587.1 Outer membrane protein beta-barrel domain-containing protein [Catalinimonas alkaloidigena]
MKILPTLAVLLSCSFPALAQQGLHVGLVSSYNTTWVLDQQMFDSPEFEVVPSYAFAPVGLSVGYHFSDEVGLFGQAILTNIRQTFDVEELDVAIGERTTELQYLNVPILFRFSSSPDRTVGFNFYIGPQFSFLLRGEERFTFDGGTNSPFLTYEATYASTDNDDKYQFNTFDFGGVIAFGAFFNLTEDLYLTLDIRANGNVLEMREKAWVEAEESLYKNLTSGYRGDMSKRHVVWGGVEAGLHYVFSSAW